MERINSQTPPPQLCGFGLEPRHGHGWMGHDERHAEGKIRSFRICSMVRRAFSDERPTGEGSSHGEQKGGDLLHQKQNRPLSPRP